MKLAVTAEKRLQEIHDWIFVTSDWLIVLSHSKPHMISKLDNASARQNQIIK